MCKDCRASGVTTRRRVVRAGRCATHDRAFRQAQSASRHAAYVRKNYAITADQYLALYESQGGVCALCRRATGAVRRLSVDHDHGCCPGPTSCGRCVRGLLCGPCNKMLGHIRDSVEMSERITNYVLDPPAQSVLKSTQGREGYGPDGIV